MPLIDNTQFVFYFISYFIFFSFYVVFFVCSGASWEMRKNFGGAFKTFVPLELYAIMNSYLLISVPTFMLLIYYLIRSLILLRKMLMVERHGQWCSEDIKQIQSSLHLDHFIRNRTHVLMIQISDLSLADSRS